MKIYFHDNTPAAPGEKHGIRGPTHCATATVDEEYQVEQHVLDAGVDLPMVVRIECPDLGREWHRTEGEPTFVEIAKSANGNPACGSASSEPCAHGNVARSCRGNR